MALSKIPDLTHSYKGQDYIFVDQLEDYLKEIECPICCGIVSEPVLTSCGHLFCGECHDKLGSGRRQRVSSRTPCSGECPVCKQEHTTVQDSFIDRRVKNLKVRCTNYQYGCKWVGNLGDELQHRLTPHSCHFEEIQCPHGCGKTIRSMTRSRHLNECPMRPHECQYCGKEGPYRKIVQGHLNSCRRYPVRCPNGCNERIPREDTASYKLKKAVSSMETKLQAEEQRVRDLEEEIQSKTDRIRQLKSETKAKERHICDLERDTTIMTQRISDLKRDTKAKTERILHLERDTKAKTVRICDLEWDTATKTQYIYDLERDAKAMTECMRQLESDTKAKTEHICDLERNTTIMAQCISDLEKDAATQAQRICDLQRDAEANTEHIRDYKMDATIMAQRISDLERDAATQAQCICDLQRDTEAKAEHIRNHKRTTTTQAQRITQLITENSEKQKKLKHIKLFIVFALGFIVLFRLHPLYFIPVFILYSAASA